MQPYQSAAEETSKQATSPYRMAKNIATTIAGGAGVAGGGALLKRVLPFLSSFIPQDMAIKGIKKIHPKMGEFIESSMNQGHQFDELSNFIKEKAGVKGEDFAKGEKNPQEMERQSALKQFNQKKKPGLVEEETNRFQEHYGQKQNNASDEALMAALNKILTM